MKDFSSVLKSFNKSDYTIMECAFGPLPFYSSYSTGKGHSYLDSSIRKILYNFNCFEFVLKNRFLLSQRRMAKNKSVLKQLNHTCAS